MLKADSSRRSARAFRLDSTVTGIDIMIFESTHRKRKTGKSQLVPLKPLIVAAVLVCAVTAKADQQNRFYLADRSDFGAKKGFYLDFENTASPGNLCRLSTMKIIFGVADGDRWQFLVSNPAWTVGGDYVVVATADGSTCSLTINGNEMAHEAGIQIAPIEKLLTAASMPGWASDPADYYIKETFLSITDGPLGVKLPISNPKAAPLALFATAHPTQTPMAPIQPGARLRIEAHFTVEPYPTDLHSLAPMVDRYGQSRYGDWPSKVQTDADLTKAAALEKQTFLKWGLPKGLDSYGGCKNAWHVPATGYFHVLQRSGKWWMVSPDGNPLFYTGLCTAPAITWDKTPVTGREYLFAQLPPRDATQAWDRGVWDGDSSNEYASLPAMNLIRKFGKTKWTANGPAEAVSRLRHLGFSGFGKWCEPTGKEPIVQVLQHAAVPNLVRHPDIFNPLIQAKFKEVLTNQIIPSLGDPLVVGWSLGNEYDEIITADEVKHIVSDHPNSPAAIELSHRVPSGDVETMRREFAAAYYKFVYDTVKAIDPNHLYFGFWIVPGWWENDEDWRLIARYCDVIGMDHYSDQFSEPSLFKLMSETGKPVLYGEFSFPSFYNGERGFGLFDQAWTQSDADSGAGYSRYIHEAATNPFCVGALWFQYRDEPITGRGPGKDGRLVDGEHYAFGVVDVTDRIKWDLAIPMREANLNAVHWRLGK